MISRHISKTQTAQLISRISEIWGLDMPRQRSVIVHQLADEALLIVGEHIRILQMGDMFVPFLSDEALLERFPTVVVDKGAIRFVCNGADTMRPGIERYGTFGVGQVVTVSEPGGRYLAVGIAAVDSSVLDGMDRGIVVKSAHYISDKYWESGKNIR